MVVFLIHLELFRVKTVAQESLPLLAITETGNKQFNIGLFGLSAF
jgi:hypothetical protein